MAIDTFLKIGALKGESTDDKHKDEIVVLSWSFEVETALVHNATGGASAVGRTNFKAFSFAHLVDRASPGLMKACATGEHIPEAVLTARKPGRVARDYIVIKLSDVIVATVSVADGTSGDPAMESVTMHYGKIEYTYTGQKADGSPDTPTEFKFDVNANRVI
jgi:type VI secretion system secreted protein Hcp